MPLLLRFLNPATVIGYIALSLIVSFFGRRRLIGFWGFFFLSLIVTPVATGFFLFVCTPVKAPRQRPPRVNAGA